MNMASWRREGARYICTPPVFPVLTIMAEETRNTQPSQKTQNIRNTSQDVPHYHSRRRHCSYRERGSRPAEKPEEKPEESEEHGLDDEETEQDRSSDASLQVSGGSRGKPPKRVIEEWANDIYCE
jgi:hypothetical protein